MQKAEIVLVYSNGAGQNVCVAALPKVGETMKARSWSVDCDGGKGTNIAVALRRLGVPTALICRTGDDTWADICGRWLEEAGVDTTFAIRDPNINTMTGVVFIDDEGRNSIVLSDSDMTVPTELIDEGLTANRTSRIFITGFEIDEQSALYAMRRAHQMGMTTMINPSPAPVDHRPDLSDADIVFVNEIEAEQLLYAAGVTCECGNWWKISECLLKSYGCSSIVITLGGGGYCVNERGKYVRGESAKVKVVDSSGAGDGFLAATAFRLLRGDCLPDACAWANLYAGLVVQHSGTIPGYLLLDQVNERIGL